ncbi:hypothetical protein CQY21_29615 [Mycolicibacterium boenickei]|nr:hypothetical protein CQY21_29615 [Mycolicibacterium boenickei]
MPFERRRPIPPFGSADEIKRAVEYPYFLRATLIVMAVAAVFFLSMVAYAFANRDHQNMVLYTVFVAVFLAFQFGATKFALPLLARRFYDRVMRGGVLCDVYPAGLPDAKAAILIDARLPDAQAAYVHDVIVSWLGRVASDPAARAQAPDLFAGSRIRSADELAGPHARGGFLVAHDKDPHEGWRLILPETKPGDPNRPYSNGLVVQVKTPSLESAGQ